MEKKVGKLVQEMHKCDFCPYETDTCQKLVYDHQTACIKP